MMTHRVIFTHRGNLAVTSQTVNAYAPKYVPAPQSQIVQYLIWLLAR